MLNCQVVRAVALLLPVDQKDSREQHLLLAIVKALAAFTNHRSDECAQQVTSCESGDSSHDSPVSFYEAESMYKVNLLITSCATACDQSKVYHIHPFFSINIVRRFTRLLIPSANKVFSCRWGCVCTMSFTSSLANFHSYKASLNGPNI